MHNLWMKIAYRKIYRVRYNNVRKIVDDLSDAAGRGGLSVLADKLGKAQPQVSAFAGTSPTKKIGDSIAEQIESVFSLPESSLDEESFDFKNGKLVAGTQIETTQAERIPFEELSPEMELLERVKQSLGKLPRNNLEIICEHASVPMEEIDCFLERKIISFESLKNLLETQNIGHYLKSEFRMLPRKWSDGYKNRYFNPYVVWKEESEEISKDFDKAFSI